MNLTPMSYKDYVWPYNPETVKIERAKNIGNFKIPYSGSVLQNLGENGRAVSGSGRFTGSGCADEFKRLTSVFSLSGTGQLRLPGVSPFQAVFSSLTMKGEAKPDCIGYEFVFLEDSSSSAAEESRVNDTESCVCAEGETLWDIADTYGVSVDTLLALNPGIEWPGDLKAGQKVVLV